MCTFLYCGKRTTRKRYSCKLAKQQINLRKKLEYIRYQPRNSTFSFSRHNESSSCARESEALKSETSNPSRFFYVHTELLYIHNFIYTHEIFIYTHIL